MTNPLNFQDLDQNQKGLREHVSVLIDDSIDIKVVESLGIDFLHGNASYDLRRHLDNILALVV